MSRFNVFRLLREMVREVNSYGQEELEAIKQRTVALKRELDALKAMRDARKAATEAAVLADLRRQVAAMQKVDAQLDQQAQQVIETADSLEQQMKAALEDHLKGQMAKAMESLDTEKLLGLKVGEAADGLHGRGGGSDSGGGHSNKETQGEATRGHGILPQDRDDRGG